MISLKNSIYNVFNKERLEKDYVFNFHSIEEQHIAENDFLMKKSAASKSMK